MHRRVPCGSRVAACAHARAKVWALWRIAQPAMLPIVALLLRDLYKAFRHTGAAQSITVDHIGSAVLPMRIRLQRKPHVLGMANTRRRNIELAVTEARLGQVDAHTLQRLPLRFLRTGSEAERSACSS